MDWQNALDLSNKGVAEYVLLESNSQFDKRLILDWFRITSYYCTRTLRVWVVSIPAHNQNELTMHSVLEHCFVVACTVWSGTRAVSQEKGLIPHRLASKVVYCVLPS